MKGYFIYTNDQQKGPFSIQELKELGINQSTPIWREGFDTWKKAGEIEELGSCYETVPPPYSAYAPTAIPTQSNRASSAERAGKKVGKLLIWTGLIVVIAVVAGFIYNKTTRTTSSYISTPAPILDPEKYNPTIYLNASGKYWKNIWGNKITINGTVKNSATHTNYKDIQITIYFYSKTKSVINTQSYTLYEYFSYGMTKEFELKVNIPSNMESCGWEATGATPL